MYDASIYVASKGAGRNEMIDLRSDTVTRPSAGMRDAMANADVGDDVYGDDPTVARLEERVAELLGKEAGLFVTSGTQSNLIALLSHCGRGEEYIGGAGTHIAKYEAGGAAVLGGISPRHIMPMPNGALDVADVEAAIQPDDPHFAVTKLVCLENTFNGLVIPQADILAVSALAHEQGLNVHLDGARLMNAVAVTGLSASELAAPADSVSLCLSKGLGAPVGSVLVGPGSFIARARRNRKLLGGGLRQSGVLAACGLYALENNVARLARDHERAARLGAALEALEGVALSQPLHTNMLWLWVDVTLGRPALAPFLAERGIVAAAPDAKGNTRLVTHLDLDDAMVETVIAAFQDWASSA